MGSVSASDSPGDRSSGLAKSDRAGASTINRGVSRLSLAEIARRGTIGRGDEGKRRERARNSPCSPERQFRAGDKPRLSQRAAPIRVPSEKNIPSPPSCIPSPPPLFLSPAVAVPCPRGRSYLDVVSSAVSAGTPAVPPVVKPAGKEKARRLSLSYSLLAAG